MKQMTEKQIKKYAEIARQTYQKEVIENTVEWFAKQMKDELNEHLDRPGWKKEPMNYLWNRLVEECLELDTELKNRPSKKIIIKECADVANFAMMIADVYEKGKFDE